MDKLGSLLMTELSLGPRTLLTGQQRVWGKTLIDWNTAIRELKNALK